MFKVVIQPQLEAICSDMNAVAVIISYLTDIMTLFACKLYSYDYNVPFLPLLPSLGYVNLLTKFTRFEC